MKMRKTLLARATMLSLGGALALCMAAAVPLSAQAQTSAPTERQTLDSVVAVVNEGVIMRSELDDRMAQVERQAEARGESLPARGQLESQVLERMIVEEIQLQMARDANLSIDDTELNRQVRSIAESNNMSLEEFADALEADGITLASVREDVRREMLMRQVQQRQVGNRVNISDSEVDRLLSQQSSQSGEQAVIQETRARHILIELTPTRNESQARAKAQEVRERLGRGEDFAKVAREMSDDNGSALNGGGLGWLRPGQTVPAFEDAMRELPLNQISEPIRSQFGYHIIQVQERRQQDVTQEAQREEVRQAIFQRRANQELETWQQQIRSQAFVDVRL
ncbi:peptidylprolyl isomerase [Vreelandella arcis]|uniref:Peptidyl-prolyl cis-trans isomerase SurA n=1 Tax=Vreelandella arcis TaxID=416873 RepID=A0A1H0HP18_9GAMM|nr:peptidylprolyl isomerase [Halomonas arcis]SDO20915.1 peptidyl-prolyl cis-trans isomerase SurA [Halomonas arcis]